MRDKHWGSQPPGAASYPGLPEERLLIGLVIIVAVLMALAAPRVRLSLPVPDASRWARSPGPGGCGCGRGDTMNVFTAKQPGAADRVALARLGGDPATMIAAAPRHARTHLTPALMGVG